MQTKTYWELDMLDLPFKQKHIKKEFDSIDPRAYGLGQCFGICLTIKEKISANPSKDPVKIVRQVSTKLTNSEYWPSNERIKNQKLILRIYVNQNLQWYHKTSGLKGKCEIDEDILSKEIHYSGSALIAIRDGYKGHELLVIKDRKENAYRIFDPNYGLSVALTLDYVLVQVDVIKRAYGFNRAEIEFHYGYKSYLKQLIPMLLGVNFSFDNSQLKSSKAKAYHIVKVILGEITSDDPKLSAEKIYSDLGEGLVKYIVFCSLYYNLLPVKPCLDHKKVHVRLKSFGFVKEAELFRKLNSFRLVVGDTKFYEAVDKGFEAVVKMMQEEKINARDPFLNSTKLHGAALEGDVEKVKALLLLGAEVNARDVFGHTPLHKAVHSGECISGQQSREIVSTLIQHGAIVFITDCLGRTAIDNTTDPKIKQMLLGVSLPCQLILMATAFLGGLSSYVVRSVQTTALGYIEFCCEALRYQAKSFSSNIGAFCDDKYNKLTQQVLGHGRNL